jgi:hypothetical protein
MMTEAQIQRAVFEHLRRRPAKGVFAFHPANGGWRLATEARILKGMGVIAGVPDVIIYKFGRPFALELKTEKGRLSAEQILTIGVMEQAGVACHTAYGLDAALDWLEREGILVGERT